MKELKKGHFYRWIGPKNRDTTWNGAGEMDFILDGKPHECRKFFYDYGTDKRIGADFIGNERKGASFDTWFWCEPENLDKYFIEIILSEKGQYLLEF